MTSSSSTAPGSLFVRQPSPLLANGQISHIDTPFPGSISHTLALSQWNSYQSVFTSLGWNIITIPPADSCPDSVFIEDMIVVFDDIAILTSPGHSSRQPELEKVKQTIDSIHRDISITHVYQLFQPASLDGGDILKVGKTVYVGKSLRTNQLAIDQLKEILHPRGWIVKSIPVSKALHLKSAVTALPDGTVIGYDPIVDDKTLFEKYLSVPEEHGVAVVILSDTHLLMSSDAPQTKQVFISRGYQVTTVDISQFEAIEGCVTCLSVRIRRPPSNLLE